MSDNTEDPPGRAEPLALYLDATTATVQNDPVALFATPPVFAAAQRLLDALEDKVREVGQPTGLYDEPEPEAET